MGDIHSLQKSPLDFVFTFPIYYHLLTSVQFYLLEGEGLRNKLKGYFMLFRILPVMVWSVTGSLIGTAAARLDTLEVDWLAFGLVLSVAALVQGYPTHIINEIYDWKSGADGRALRPNKSGGSKVLQARLLSIHDLWRGFALSHLVLFVLILYCALKIDLNIVLYFIVPGYLSGVLYTLPPFRLAYRPFLGDWLGGFAGMFFLVTGSYYAQTFSLTPFALLMATGVGLIYVAIMVYFHYLDHEHDQLADPAKRTTVVFLGLEGCRMYACGCLVLSVLLLLISGFKFHVASLGLLPLSSAVLLSHLRAELRSAASIIKWGKVMTMAVLIAGIAFAILADTRFVLMVAFVATGFWAHKKFGKLGGLSPRTPS